MTSSRVIFTRKVPPRGLPQGGNAAEGEAEFLSITTTKIFEVKFDFTSFDLCSPRVLDPFAGPARTTAAKTGYTTSTLYSISTSAILNSHTVNMSGIQPVALYAMRVPPGDYVLPATPGHAAMVSA
jgi:hypothetical protein